MTYRMPRIASTAPSTHASVFPAIRSNRLDIETLLTRVLVAAAIDLGYVISN
jgi:hypothetical protein